jgi:TM2 domain-containing membrane protein YozV
MGGMGQLQTKKFPKQRHFLAVFFISFMWGTFGADRMYLGKWGTGILKLITLGGCGLWTIVDLILIMSGAMRDKQGREMLQFAEYKAFAYKMVLIFAVVLGMVVLINGLFLLAAVMQFMTDFQNGKLPNIDAFNSLQGLSPAERLELGL